MDRSAQEARPDTGGTGELELRMDPPERIAEILLAPAVADPELPRGAEVAGLVTALLELGLADLDGLVPRVEGQAPSPGLAEALVEDGERWTLTPRLSEADNQLVVDLRLCTAGGACADLRSTAGTRAEPTPGVAELLDALASRLTRAEAEGSGQDRASVLSDDPYAVLLAGRAAATWYGLLPPTPEAFLGHRRRDPVTRALIVDPDTSVGNWIAGRRAASTGTWDEARRFFAAAAFARPSSTLLLADEAAALLRGGRAEGAWYAWQQVMERSPRDLRYAVLAARAALAAGQPQAALADLLALPPPWRELPVVLGLRCDALEAQGRTRDPEYDRNLALWAEGAPADPEPLRRRVGLRVNDGRYEEALALASELAARGAAEEAAAIEVALLNALDRPAEAARRAVALGDARLAGRLNTRSNTADPAAVADSLAGDPNPAALAARALALTRAGQADQGLADATAALQADPWLPEAMAAQAEALDGLGRGQEATEARALLCELDPGWEGCARAAQ